jgi:hypothetical protein
MQNKLFSIKIWLTAALTTVLFIPTTVGNNTMQEMNRELEEWQLGLLAQVKNSPEARLQPFTTDGCSGGLSEGWNAFSKLIPDFREKFGDKPPWEQCCVDHDQAYWKGEVTDGYQKRLEADRMLRQCVIEYGRNNSARIADKFEMDRQTVEQHFNYAGELMYQAVRVGGKPCSLLPWRWGYGWPHCHMLSGSNSGPGAEPESR